MPFEEEAGSVTAEQGASFADAGGGCSRWRAQKQSFEIFDLDFVSMSGEGSHEHRGDPPRPMDAQLTGSAHEHALGSTAGQQCDYHVTCWKQNYGDSFSRSISSELGKCKLHVNAGVAVFLKISSALSHRGIFTLYARWPLPGRVRQS